MNVSVQAVGERSGGNTPSRYALRRPSPTRPISTNSTQVVSELTDTLKRIMANAMTLLGVRNCWIAGLDQANQKLITIAASSQDSSEESYLRSLQHQHLASWVATNRTPAVVDDMLSDPRCQGTSQALGGSMLSVPLLSGQQLLGAITVSNSTPGSLQQHALLILHMLADQTIIAISKARQAEASQQQAHELATFLDIAKAMTSPLDTRQVLNAIVIGIRRLIQCDEAVIFGFAERAQELRAVARLDALETELEDLRIPLRDKQSVAAWVAQNRRPILQAPGGRVFVGRITGVLLGDDDLALLGVPLLSKDQLYGVALLGRFTPFSASELRTMVNLSNLIALALEQVSI